MERTRSVCKCSSKSYGFNVLGMLHKHVKRLPFSTRGRTNRTSLLKSRLKAFQKVVNSLGANNWVLDSLGANGAEGAVRSLNTACLRKSSQATANSTLGSNLRVVSKQSGRKKFP